MKQGLRERSRQKIAGKEMEAKVLRSDWNTERKGMVEVWVGREHSRKKTVCYVSLGPHERSTGNHAEGSGRTTEWGPFRDFGYQLLVSQRGRIPFHRLPGSLYEEEFRAEELGGK